MDYLCPQTCKEILVHYVKQHQKVGKELMQKHQENPHRGIHIQDIVTHQELAELVDLCHEIYHIVIELENGYETDVHAHDVHARTGPPVQPGMHTGAAPGLSSIVGKPHP